MAVGGKVFCTRERAKNNSTVDRSPRLTVGLSATQRVQRHHILHGLYRGYQVSLSFLLNIVMLIVVQLWGHQKYGKYIDTAAHMLPSVRPLARPLAGRAYSTSNLQVSFHRPYKAHILYLDGFLLISYSIHEWCKRKRRKLHVLNSYTAILQTFAIDHMPRRAAAVERRGWRSIELAKRLCVDKERRATRERCQ